eukprot:354318-Chlamydomonas_euryale.AAC.2
MQLRLTPRACLRCFAAFESLLPTCRYPCCKFSAPTGCHTPAVASAMLTADRLFRLGLGGGTSMSSPAAAGRTAGRQERSSRLACRLNSSLATPRGNEEERATARCRKLSKCLARGPSKETTRALPAKHGVVCARPNDVLASDPKSPASVDDADAAAAGERPLRADRVAPGSSTLPCATLEKNFWAWLRICTAVFVPTCASMLRHPRP